MVKGWSVRLGTVGSEGESSPHITRGTRFSIFCLALYDLAANLVQTPAPAYMGPESAGHGLAQVGPTLNHDATSRDRPRLPCT